MDHGLWIRIGGGERNTSKRLDTHPSTDSARLSRTADLSVTSLINNCSPRMTTVGP